MNDKQIVDWIIKKVDSGKKIKIFKIYPPEYLEGFVIATDRLWISASHENLRDAFKKIK